jgi:hypothetical protein
VARADLAERLRGGLLGVALGEALGLPWAGVSPRAIRRDRLLEGVGATGGATAAVLAWGGGQSPSAGAQGLSPTAAVGDSPQPALRDCPLPQALAVGWRHRDHAAARRAAALPLGFAAVVVADLAAATLAGKAVHQLVTDHADDWPPPFHGVASDDRSVVDALLAVLQRHDDPSEAMRAAVRLGGGGTAVLGALVGGILGCRRPTAIDRVPWRDRVALPDEATLAAAVARLATH